MIEHILFHPPRRRTKSRGAVFLRQTLACAAVAALVCLCPPKASSKETSPRLDLPRLPFDAPLMEGLRHVLVDRYAEGIACFEAARKRFPDHPGPYFFKAAAYQSWMTALRTRAFEHPMEENLQTAIQKGLKAVEADDDPWAHFFVGAAYGYRAFNAFHQHRWIRAYLDARKGVAHLEKARERAPSLYDVYLGLGTYHYWRTARSRFLRLVAFWMRDERERGLKELELASSMGRYAPAVALLNLAVAYFDYGRYDRALRVLDRARQKGFGPSITDIHLRGRIMVHFGRWREAEALFREALLRLHREPYPSVGYQVECAYYLAVSLHAQGRDEEAFRVAKTALVQGASRRAERELEGPFESFGETMGLVGRLEKTLEKAPSSPAWVTASLPAS